MKDETLRILETVLSTYENEETVDEVIRLIKTVKYLKEELDKGWSYTGSTVYQFMLPKR